MSKSYGLAGWRVGSVCYPPRLPTCSLAYWLTAYRLTTLLSCLLACLLNGSRPNVQVCYPSRLHEALLKVQDTMPTHATIYSQVTSKLK